MARNEERETAEGESVRASEKEVAAEFGRALEKKKAREAADRKLPAATVVSILLHRLRFIF